MHDQTSSTEDTNPLHMEHQTSEIVFADPTNHQYPIDTRQHILDAWDQINREAAAKQYSRAELRLVKDRIKQAARKIGFEINEG